MNSHETEGQRVSVARSLVADSLHLLPGEAFTGLYPGLKTEKMMVTDERV